MSPSAMELSVGTRSALPSLSLCGLLSTRGTGTGVGHGPRHHPGQSAPLPTLESPGAGPGSTPTSSSLLRCTVAGSSGTRLKGDTVGAPSFGPTQPRQLQEPGE